MIPRITLINLIVALVKRNQKELIEADLPLIVSEMESKKKIYEKAVGVFKAGSLELDKAWREYRNYTWKFDMWHAKNKSMHARSAYLR